MPKLEDLLLPDTPDGVRKGYRSLAKRAAEQDFGLLEQDVVVLDTETTGLSPRRCGLIEIAAARLEGRKVAERFQTFVDPGQPIPDSITALTGITEADIAGAPGPEEAVAALAEFVGGLPVLAHNAEFDRAFIERVPGGADVSPVWIDTLALSRIALPRLSSHRLADLAEAFGCEAVSHRAMDDVDALAGVWRVLLCGLDDLPGGLLGALADMHDDVDWPYRPIFSHLAAAKAPSQLSMEAARKELVDVIRERQRLDPAEEGACRVPSPQELADQFAEGGIVERMYGSYERRPEQQQMSELIRSALASSSHRAIEAGTGVGKSIAYLLPLALFAQENDYTCGVATKTNALSDQLVSHELPALAKELPEGLAFFSLKGYDHYLCLRKALRAMDGLPDAADDDARRAMLDAIAVSLAFAAQSPSGDIDALGIRWNSVPRAMLTTTPDECHRTSCPFYPRLCMLHGARRRAASADIVVTNHSLLLTNVKTGGKILPPIRHWVIDEAHSLEQEARRQWAVELSSSTTRSLFEALGGARSGEIHRLMTMAAKTQSSTLLTGLLVKASTAASRASIAMGALFEETRGLARLAQGAGGYDTARIWIGGEVLDSPEWARVSEAALAAHDLLEQACLYIDDALEALSDELPEADTGASDMNRDLKGLVEALELIGRASDDSYVFSAEIARKSSAPDAERLLAEKYDVGGELAERWLPETQSVSFTSATIAVGEDFSHFEHSVGLDRIPPEDRKAARLDSSFDFDASMAVAVCRDLPQPNDPAYLGALEELLYDVHTAMGGSVLTLFTNRREMEQVYAALKPRLADAGLDLACQERGSSARWLRERFIAEEKLSLMALKSFWEGFDAAGDTLRCVVVPRLPFASPTDPLVRERDRREERAWWRYSLPEAVLSVKQAAGRLIRTASDTGVLVLADSRLVEKRYGRAFISSLPSSDVRVLGKDEVGEFIASWRRYR